MDKKILSEINRGREIMGLDLLLTEKDNPKYVHDVEKMKVPNYQGIIKKVMNKLRKSDVPNAQVDLPGFKELRIIMSKRGFYDSMGQSGKKITFSETLASLVKKLGSMKSAVSKLLEGGLKVETSTIEVPVTNSGNLHTYGRVHNYGKKVDKSKTNKPSFTRSFLMFINGYNRLSFASGGRIFDITTMIDDANKIDVTSGPTDDGSNGLLLYSMRIGSENEVTPDYEDEKVEGIKSTGKYGMKWASGEDEPDQTIVKEAVDEIIRKFPAEHADKVTLFKLKAGATANWGDEILKDSQGVGENFTTKGNELLNQQLAFSRGNKFMIAINAGLKSNDHPGFDNYEINWEVKGQDVSGQFIDLMLDLNIPDKFEKIFKGTSEKGDGQKRAGKGQMFMTRITL